jgi:hypothetical protein
MNPQTIRQLMETPEFAKLILCIRQHDPSMARKLRSLAIKIFDYSDKLQRHMSGTPSAAVVKRTTPAASEAKVMAIMLDQLKTVRELLGMINSRQVQRTSMNKCQSELIEHTLMQTRLVTAKMDRVISLLSILAENKKTMRTGKPKQVPT